jgi:hypothetical protein
MKLVAWHLLLEAGSFSRTRAWSRIRTDIETAVDRVRWPVGGPDFAINPEPGKRRGEGNGVKPIKRGFIKHLESRGWKKEGAYPSDAVEGVSRPGAFDAFLELSEHNLPPFVVEWETGNISSSHRAMNKMALGVLSGSLSGGVLVLPTRTLYRYLTDRVGNINEITPYFPLWSASPAQAGVLGIVTVEHDREDPSVERIPKGTDGRSAG